MANKIKDAVLSGLMGFCVVYWMLLLAVAVILAAPFYFLFQLIDYFHRKMKVPTKRKAPCSS